MSIVAKRVSINCDAADFAFYQQVTSGNDPREAPFEHYIDAFTAFACVGYHYDAFEPITSEKRELTLASYLVEHDDRLLVLLSLAYARSKVAKPDMTTRERVVGLLSTAGILPIVEGWANAGVRIVREMYESGTIASNRTIGLADELLSYLEAQSIGTI